MPKKNQPASSSGHSLISPPFGIAASFHSSAAPPKEPVPVKFYQDCHQSIGEFKEAEKIFCKYYYDHEQWLRLFYEESASAATKRALRSLVQIHTIVSLLRGKYFICSQNNTQVKPQEELQLDKDQNLDSVQVEASINESNDSGEEQQQQKQKKCKSKK